MDNGERPWGNEEPLPVDKTVVSNIPVMTKVENTAPQRRVPAGAAPTYGAPGTSASHGELSPYGASPYGTQQNPSAYDPYAPVAASPTEPASLRGACRANTAAHAPRRGASALRWLVRLLGLGLLIFGAMTIFYLTEQTVDQTSSLSSSAGDFVEKGAWIVESGQLPAFKDDPIKWAGCVILLISQKFVRHGLEVRQQAHVVEFALLGGVIALNVLAWMSGWAHRRDERGRIHGSRTLLMYVLSVGLCAAASFADQYHKLYVPGRHFDSLDLILDASGYLTAVTGVFVVWSIGSALYRLIFRK